MSMSNNISGDTFRLVWYETLAENKYQADRRHEFLGGREAVFTLWFTLVKRLGERHVEVYSLDGRMQEPEKGLSGLSGLSL